MKDMVKLLTKLTLKHEDESSRLRAETVFMLCLDTNDEGITTDLLDVSNTWKELRAQNKVSSSLRVTLCLAILKELISLHGLSEGKAGQQRLDSYWRPAPGSVLDILGVESSHKAVGGSQEGSNQELCTDGDPQ